jgi:hypothetical protein
MPQNFLSPSVKVKELEEQGESAIKASLAKGMRIRLGLDLRSADTLGVQLIGNCCGQPYYPDKAWKGSIKGHRRSFGVVEILVLDDLQHHRGVA